MKTSAKVLLVAGALLFSINSLYAQHESFQFVFMTDIHLQPEANAVKGFKQAIQNTNELNPDFVVTGGDLIMDALKQSYGRADSLYTLYETISAELNMPVYNSLGNHEIFGICNTKTDLSNNPEYNEVMFEQRLGASYYAFKHKGWKFFVLNSVEQDKHGCYLGLIDKQQMIWIKKELAKTNQNTPLVISTHIPFITSFRQVYDGSTLACDSSLVVANSKKVLDLFGNHKLKLVLQGHTHILEDIFINGTHFITGGAICGRWWKGPNRGTEEGFLLLELDGEDISWDYIDYGWEVVK